MEYRYRYQLESTSHKIDRQSTETEAQLLRKTAHLWRRLLQGKWRLGWLHSYAISIQRSSGAAIITNLRAKDAWRLFLATKMYVSAGAEIGVWRRKLWRSTKAMQNQSESAGLDNRSSQELARRRRRHAADAASSATLVMTMHACMYTQCNWPIENFPQPLL